MPNLPKLFVSLVLMPLSAFAAPPSLNFCFEDVLQRPWTKPDGTGLNIVLLQRVARQLGEHFTYSAKPWSRCQEEVRNGTSDGVFGVSDTSERRQYSVYPTLPDGKSDPEEALYEDRFDVYLRIGGRASWNSMTLSSPERPIIAQRDYYVAALLRDRGYNVVEYAKSAEDGLRFLSHGMADAAVLQGVEAQSLAARDPRFSANVKRVEPSYLILPLYLAVGRGVYEHDPKRIKAIWTAIREVRASAQYRRVQNSAGIH
ncbi:MAG TPA: transporter substrate-binding domain-containing protein [Burkholderiaceae bacterium]|jgi:polar amino acid transport system substrate-binding protein